MPDISVEQMLDALSPLEHLQSASGKFLTAAPRILGKTLECPWAVILRHGDTAANRAATAYAVRILMETSSQNIRRNMKYGIMPDNRQSAHTKL